VSILMMLLGILVPASAAEVVSVISSDAAPYRAAHDALVQRLSMDGHQVRSVSMDALAANGLSALGQPACVVAIGSPAAVWLHGHKPTIPLAYCLVSNPERAGLLTPPAAIGVTTDIPLADQLSLLREALPDAKSIGLLFRQNDPDSQQQTDALRTLLPAGMTVEAIAIDQQPSPAAAIDALLARRIDVVWTSPDSTIWNEATVRSLLLTALRRKVPVFGFSTAFVRAGALVGVGLDPANQGAQAGALVSDHLAGRTTTAQVVPPIFDICLNLVVAQKLSLTVPKPLLERAKQVFGGGR
jgi:putative tryptophan/tyrosine transport system substrate-binding protein